MNRSDEFAGKRVVVMGLGRFGGGIGVTRFLVDRGADVLVTDLEAPGKLTQSIAQIQDLIDLGGVEMRLGEHNVSDFTICDLVVVNPAVKPGNRFVRAAEAAGIEVTTEMRLFVQRLPNRLRTIGVTGSAGKSTVTAMIGHVLGKVMADGGCRMADGKTEGVSNQVQPPSAIAHPPSPRVWVGGNIGGSLLPHLDEIGEDDWVVLELSSFMLERLKQDAHFPGWSPHIAVITNISPNHLDWHGSMAEYVAAKGVIFEYQKLDTEINADISISGPGVMPYLSSRVPNNCVWIESDMQACLEGITGLSVPGRHNRVNAELVNWVFDEIDSSADAIEMLADFPGLPHRLQLVAEHDGVRYFNDSKCTTPEAAMLAVEAFVEEGKEEKGDCPRFVHLILGGKDKGSDMTPLAGFASEKCKAVYTIGALGEAIADLVGTAAEAASAELARPESCGGVSWPAATAEVVRCGDLDSAVAQLKERVAPGDVVLLSPACASWDQFENYEQRGKQFIALVEQLIIKA